MYTVTVRQEFNAAHKLRDYQGKCEALHGHNWIVEISLKSQKLDKNGMVMDFSHLKEELAKLLESLDHKLLNEIEPFINLNPTSENIAKHIFDNLKSKYSNLSKVTVWETSTSCASYKDTD